MDEVALDGLQLERLGRLRAELELSQAREQLAGRERMDAERALRETVEAILKSKGMSGAATVDFAARVIRVHSDEGGE